GDHHVLWSLDLATGATQWSRTVDAPGSDPAAQQERGALALLDGRVYVPFGGLFGDCSQYKGRVESLPESGVGDLQSFTTDNQREAGIWAPPGPAARDGSLYVATGNGSPAGAVDDSDSVLRLSPSLRVQGRFTPADYASLSLHDTDLGSTSPALLPGGLVFIAGKQGIGYVLDGARLGGTGGQLASRRICGGAFGGDATEGDTVMVACFQQLVAVRVTPPGHGRRAGLRVVWTAGVSAGPPIVAG
ncbi:MAG: hypothetical protein ACYCUG_14700, partial [Acidimicrobiales bacterium]